MKSGFSICFLGVDGSGKSTLAKRLCHELKRRSYDVSYVWWLKGDRSRLRRALKALGSSHYVKLEVDEERQKVITRDGRFFNRAFNSFYPLVILVDYLWFGLENAWLPRIYKRNKIIIFDRFMYDVILALSEEFGFASSTQMKLFRLFSALLPNPQLIFLVEVPPEVCYGRRRKEMTSVKEAYDKKATYQALTAVLNKLTDGKIVEVDNTRDLGVVDEEVLSTTLGALRRL